MGIRILLLAAALTLAAAPAFPQPQSRQEALTALASAETTARMEAIVWLANHGSMADAKLLHERLRDESALVRDYAERALWALWSRSGDAAIDRLMARGIEQMQSGDHKSAIATFSDVVKRKPDFAEAWNKRATVYYLAGEYEKSLADCDEVLKRNPGHFGALSGMGQIYTQLERYDQALAAFRRALDVNPNMLGVEINIKSIEMRLQEKRGKAI
ncbi:MAG TPA: tetratricopeptide repeat protein [Burkholderiales bacterium]|nr:tetratricopeptide repeat protein [Burkholderiales bacterium]